MAYDLKINGGQRSVDVDGDTPLLWGHPRRAGNDRHQVRMRHAQSISMVGRRGPARRRSKASGPQRSRRSRRSTIPRTVSRFRRLGRISTWCSADIASPGRSCRRQLCCPKSLIRQMPTSITPCQATFAVVAPLFAFAKQSNTPRSSTATRSTEAENVREGFFLRGIARGTRLTRRSFLRTGIVAGGGLLISINAPVLRADRAAAAGASAADFAPGAFLRIDKTGSDRHRSAGRNRARRLYVLRQCHARRS